jgi:ribonuclease HI
MLEIHIDGASKGNPGPASVGVIIDQDGKRIAEIAKSIGEATNNFAEYSAMIVALEEAARLKAEHLRIFTDSELLYNQLKGQYKIKSDNLKGLHKQASDLARGFKKVELKCVPREENKEADKLASSVFKKDKEQVKVVAPLFE